MVLTDRNGGYFKRKKECFILQDGVRNRSKCVCVFEECQTNASVKSLQMSGSPCKAIVHIRARRTTKTVGTSTLCFSLSKAEAYRGPRDRTARVRAGPSTDDHSRHRIITYSTNICLYYVPTAGLDDVFLKRIGVFFRLQLKSTYFLQSASTKVWDRP